MKYRVTFVRRDIKDGHVVPHGSTKVVVVKNIDSRANAIKEAKVQVGRNWKLLNATRSLGPLDPDARKR